MFNIRCESLELEEASHRTEPIYFVPMDAQKFEHYFVDLDVLKKDDLVKKFLRSWPHDLNENHD